jgi:AcrR family transcriptional regulator
MPEEVPSAGWESRVISRSLKKATQRSVERGRAFLKAADALLRSAGAEGFTVQEVADRAGYSLRTLYQHFESKDDLLLALYEEDLALHAATVRRRVDQHNDPLARLTAFIVDGVHIPVANVGHSVLMARYKLRLEASHPERLAHLYQPTVAHARELVTEAIESGAIPPCDPDAAAYMLLTLRTGYTVSRLLGNDLGATLPPPAVVARFCVLGLGGSSPRDES